MIKLIITKETSVANDAKPSFIASIKEECLMIPEYVLSNQKKNKFIAKYAGTIKTI